jgi:Flp pilus assembly protein TadB
MAQNEEDYWWAPKRYGIGAGMPLAWQAWAVAAAYSLAVVGGAWFILPLSPSAFVAIVLTATAALLVVRARKTRGGWRWRWGERD